VKVMAILKKPRSCASCPFDFCTISYEECRLSERQLTSEESRTIPEWCELVDINQNEGGKG